MWQQNGANIKLPIVLLYFARKSDDLAGLILQDLLHTAVATILDDHAMWGSYGERIDVPHWDGQAHSQVTEPRELPKELVLLVADSVEGHPKVPLYVASHIVWPAREVHQCLHIARLLPLHPVFEQPTPIFDRQFWQ